MKKHNKETLELLGIFLTPLLVMLIFIVGMSHFLHSGKEIPQVVGGAASSETGVSRLNNVILLIGAIATPILLLFGVYNLTGNWRKV